jgi:hypothetical protein
MQEISTDDAIKQFRNKVRGIRVQKSFHGAGRMTLEIFHKDCLKIVAAYSLRAGAYGGIIETWTQDEIDNVITTLKAGIKEQANA